MQASCDTGDACTRRPMGRLARRLGVGLAEAPGAAAAADTRTTVLLQASPG